MFAKPHTFLGSTCNLKYLLLSWYQQWMATLVWKICILISSKSNLINTKQVKTYLLHKITWIFFCLFIVNHVWSKYTISMSVIEVPNCVLRINDLYPLINEESLTIVEPSNPSCNPRESPYWPYWISIQGNEENMDEACRERKLTSIIKKLSYTCSHKEIPHPYHENLYSLDSRFNHTILRI